MVRDKVCRLINFNTEHVTLEDKDSPTFWQIYNKLGHPTSKCISLRRLIDTHVKKGDIQLPQDNVNDNLLPVHGANMASAYDEKAEHMLKEQRFLEETFEESLGECVRNGSP